MLGLKNIKKTGSSLAKVYGKISGDLLLVEEELKNLISDYSFESTREILDAFFKTPGKRLRPVLLLLSSKAALGGSGAPPDAGVIKMAAAMELIHAASLVHDDIIDGDLLRRGQETLNNKYDNKIAVLTGDALYTRAFLTVSEHFPGEYMRQITEMTRDMCMAEIEQAREHEFIKNKESYYRLIKYKTAIFMACCCRLGASLATSDRNTVSSLDAFGLALGMVYQIVDDFMDNDAFALKYSGLEEAGRFAEEARTALDGLHDSDYKSGLLELIDYVMGMTAQ